MGMNSYFKGKRILITGSSGYIASNLIHTLKDFDCTLVRLDRRTMPPVYPGRSEIVDITGDIQDSRVFEPALRDVDIVFHFAGQTSLYSAEDRPIDDLKVNVLPMLYLLETCRKTARQPTILFSGTATEVGIPSSLPVDETHRDRPISIYDIHKLMAENYLIYYAQKEFIRGAVLRLANVYGPGPESSSADRGVLNMMIRRALAGEPLNIYGTGEYLRDYIYVEDVVQAFIEAAVHIDRVSGKYFVIGSGEGKTLKKAVKLVAEKAALKTGKKVQIKHIDPPSPLHPIEFRNFIADPQRFFQATGFKIKYSLIEGIDRTIRSFDNS